MRLVTTLCLRDFLYEETTKEIVTSTQCYYLWIDVYMFVHFQGYLWQLQGFMSTIHRYTNTAPTILSNDMIEASTILYSRLYNLSSGDRLVYKVSYRFISILHVYI